MDRPHGASPEDGPESSGVIGDFAKQNAKRSLEVSIKHAALEFVWGLHRFAACAAFQSVHQFIPARWRQLLGRPLYLAHLGWETSPERKQQY